MDISTARDINFYEEFPRWEAELSNGTIVYSDNQYINEKSDWERLSIFCKENDLKIQNFLLGDGNLTNGFLALLDAPGKGYPFMNNKPIVREIIAISEPFISK
jgi:hypothetical protein